MDPTVSSAVPHRFTHGAFDITVLSDGYITLPGPILMPDIALEDRAPVIAAMGGSADAFHAKANIPVLRAGADLILVDTGSGNKYEPTAGRLRTNLALAGIDPSDITKVVFTHAHPDHVWGTLNDNGGLLCPDATYFVSAAEWDFWMSPDIWTILPAAWHDFARGAQRDLGAIAGRMVRVHPGEDIVAGMRVLDTAGHTPGHISLEIAGGQGLIITADAATNQLLSFAHPRWRFGYDALSDLAIANRTALIDRVACDRTLLLGYHWTYPGIGYAERDGLAWRFVPAA
ncbi:MAG: MBL fold metallo-hydrolase [Rhizobiales bacterium 24-66-13]|jgi:glyoxylase-like metal-dependent hydrolase (beta-lactamase superfamily II)|nr:MAG: MBL fold metallo-hydrolase [Rhizobiales bacterium 32-66-11]OYY14017.1 MAG: MBL fold metallo-hydrolase [Rhizobiales bacterium 35-68-8]OYZ83107.1 MAG: MBL fold metallo-hydrolase [Rhizobiales bacterium 24-66-13]OZB12038.1 MAG: MBL fold metallo-hydrolase [Rhizobiales bacterium 39-66-18]HQS45628.1 MBL fold metallo-hydrolase [Xanthobacteraceae bacterium]